MSKERNAIHKLAEGIFLNNRYEIKELLGAGGFGNTYLARDTRFSASTIFVCVKEFFLSGDAVRGMDGRSVELVNPNKAQNYEDLRLRFRREAERMFTLRDEHIVRVSDLFDENNTSYYVMDYVEGRSLAQIVNQSGAIAEKEALDYILQLLKGLRVIHQIGMVHLDIKPGNVMVDKDNKVVLIDFGASKIIEPGSATLSAAMLNTPGYAPLEQTLVRLDRIGEWTDLYAVGGTLYKLVTGNTPADAQDIIDDGDAAFKFPEHVSQDTRQLVMWMMNKRISDRPHSTEEVIARVEGILKESPVRTAPAQAAPAQPAPAPQPPVMAAPQAQPAAPVQPAAAPTPMPQPAEPKPQPVTPQPQQAAPAPQPAKPAAPQQPAAPQAQPAAPAQPAPLFTAPAPKAAQPAPQPAKPAAPQPAASAIGVAVVTDTKGLDIEEAEAAPAKKAPAKPQPMEAHTAFVNTPPKKQPAKPAQAAANVNPGMPSAFANAPTGRPMGAGSQGIQPQGFSNPPQGATPKPPMGASPMPNAAPRPPYGQPVPPYGQQPAGYANKPNNYGAPASPYAPPQGANNRGEDETQMQMNFGGNKQQQPANPFVQPKQSSGNTKTIIIVLIAFIVAAIVGAAVWFFVINGSSSSSAYDEYFNGETTTMSDGN